MPSRSPRTSLALAALTALAAGLGACRADRPATTGAINGLDYRARHPIVLADDARSLDIFATGTGHLDPRQAADIDAFLLEYRRYGRGPLILDLPSGVSPALGAALERSLASIRRAGAEAGLVPQQIVVTGYAVANPALAAPLRLSFQRMQARVASQCGEWPRDLGVSEPAYSGRNEVSWNLGCASQTNFAAQIADPIDLVRGRTEGRIDSVKRVRDINTVRDGKDPSIEWRQDGKTSVKTQVTN